MYVLNNFRAAKIRKRNEDSKISDIFILITLRNSYEKAISRHTIASHRAVRRNIWNDVLPRHEQNSEPLPNHYCPIGESTLPAKKCVVASEVVVSEAARPYYFPQLFGRLRFSSYLCTFLILGSNQGQYCMTKRPPLTEKHLII